jgi:antitoxin ParD1/3/4
MSQLKQITAPPAFSTQEELEALLLEGLDSGEPVEVTPQFWADTRAELAARRSSRKAS